MENDRKSIFAPLRPFLVVGILLLFWWLVDVLGWANPLFLPNLKSFCVAVWSQLVSFSIYYDIFATSFRALAGLVLSALVAIPIGMIFGRIPRLYDFVELPVDFFRSIPSSALFFLFILIFGIGELSKIAVVFYGCVLILLVNTIYGAKPTREKQDRINMLRSFGATPFQIYFLAVLRDALPHITAGLRVCASLSFVLVVVTEMFLSANSGLGRRIYDFYLAYRIPEMYAVIFILGIVGFVINKIFLSVERRICFWLPT